MHHSKPNRAANSVKSLLPLLQQERGKTRFALAVVALLWSEEGAALDWSTLAAEVGVSVQEARRLGIPADLPRCDFSQNRCEKSQSKSEKTQSLRVRAIPCLDPSDRFSDPDRDRVTVSADDGTFSAWFASQVATVLPDYRPSSYERRLLDEYAAAEGEDWARYAARWLLVDGQALEHAKCLGALFVRRLAPLYRERFDRGAMPMQVRADYPRERRADVQPAAPSVPWLSVGMRSSSSDSPRVVELEAEAAPIAEPARVPEQPDRIEAPRAERTLTDDDAIVLDVEQLNARQADATRRRAAWHAAQPSLTAPGLAPLVVGLVAQLADLDPADVPRDYRCPAIVRDGSLFVRVPAWGIGAAVREWTDPATSIGASIEGARRLVLVDDDDQVLLDRPVLTPRELVARC